MFLRLESFDAMSGCSDIITEHTLKTPDVSLYKDVTEATEVQFNLITRKYFAFYCIEIIVAMNSFVFDFVTKSWSTQN